MRLLYAAAVTVALVSPSLAQQTDPLDTRMCPDGSATLPDGSPCPPIVTQQGGSTPGRLQDGAIPGDVPGAGGNASRNDNNTGGSALQSGESGTVDGGTGSGATGTGVQ